MQALQQCCEKPQADCIAVYCTLSQNSRELLTWAKRREVGIATSSILSPHPFGPYAPGPVLHFPHQWWR